MPEETYPDAAWIRELPGPGRHFVYWLATIPPGRDAERAELIYVGVTSDLRSRMRSHSRKWWWPVIDLGLLALEEHPSRQEANEAESRDIHLYQPAMNRAGRLLVLA